MSRAYANTGNKAGNTEAADLDLSDIIDTGRMEEDPFDWSYENLVKEHLEPDGNLLDMGGGCGDFLSALSSFPARIHTMHRPRQKSGAGAREEASALSDRSSLSDRLPYEDQYFDLVINRRAAYHPTELHRLLKDGGKFITEQTGALSCANLILDLTGTCNALNLRTLYCAVSALEETGFRVLRKKEHIVPIRFYDIDAILFYLKAIPDLIRDFEPRLYDRQLRFIGSVIDQRGFYQTLLHGFLVIAEKTCA